MRQLSLVLLLFLGLVCNLWAKEEKTMRLQM